MKYRGISDRTISAYGAVLLITIVGGAATLLIVHKISNTDFTYGSQYAALGS